MLSALILLSIVCMHVDPVTLLSLCFGLFVCLLAFCFCFFCFCFSTHEQSIGLV